MVRCCRRPHLHSLFVYICVCGACMCSACVYVYICAWCMCVYVCVHVCMCVHVCVVHVCMVHVCCYVDSITSLILWLLCVCPAVVWGCLIDHLLMVRCSSGVFRYSQHIECCHLPTAQFRICAKVSFTSLPLPPFSHREDVLPKSFFSLNTPLSQLKRPTKKKTQASIRTQHNVTTSNHGPLPLET